MPLWNWHDSWLKLTFQVIIFWEFLQKYANSCIPLTWTKTGTWSKHAQCWHSSGQSSRSGGFLYSVYDNPFPFRITRAVPSDSLPFPVSIEWLYFPVHALEPILCLWMALAFAMCLARKWKNREQVYGKSMWHGWCVNYQKRPGHQSLIISFNQLFIVYK